MKCRRFNVGVLVNQGDRKNGEKGLFLRDGGFLISENLLSMKIKVKRKLTYSFLLEQTGFHFFKVNFKLRHIYQLCQLKLGLI